MAGDVQCILYVCGVALCSKRPHERIRIHFEGKNLHRQPSSAPRAYSRGAHVSGIIVVPRLKRSLGVGVGGQVCIRTNV